MLNILLIRIEKDGIINIVAINADMLAVKVIVVENIYPRSG